MHRSHQGLLSRAAALIAGAVLLAGAAYAQNTPHETTPRSIAYGKEAYKAGNCVGCHKWHGAGGGGYGGLALSLRATKLDRNSIVEVVRCGRPGTNMVHHDTTAWDEGRCYGGAKRSDMDPSVFPGLGKKLTEREIQSVADYVVAVLQGKGDATREECLAFWGDTAQNVCKPYPAKQ